MSSKLKFVWIDDDLGRQIASENLEKQAGVRCIFINVEPEKVDFLGAIDKNKPDLILVDHNLTEIGTGSIKKGSTIAALIREKHPSIAIACITGQDEDLMDSHQKMSYEDVFSFDAINEHYEAMKSIALAFRKMKSVAIANTSQLFSLMKAPDNDLQKLEIVVPHEIKGFYSDPSIYSNISHWIREVLMERPGFLYDRLWCATLLGLSEQGFKKVESLFTSAKYKGIFANNARERWWKSEMINLLAKRVNSTALPWEKGRHLPGITPRHYSKDYYSNYQEEYPEIVAFIDDTSKRREQMKLRHSVPHPKYEKLLFFEDIRMMKAD